MAVHTCCAYSFKGRQTDSSPSNFDQKEIVELKEAFTFIDSNGDGWIDAGDLTETLSSLGIRDCDFRNGF